MNKNKRCFFICIFLVIFFISFDIKKSLAEYSIAKWNFPNNPDDPIADDGISENLESEINSFSTNTPSFDISGATTNSARATGWQNGNNIKYWIIEFTSLEYENISISSKQRSSSTGPKDFAIEYSIDSGFSWHKITNITLADNFTTGSIGDLKLPEECSNKEIIYIRWILSSDISVAGGLISSTGSSRIDDIEIKGNLIGEKNNIDEIIEDEVLEDDEDLEEKYYEKESNYKIRINEILPNPKEDESKYEYVEIFNGENFPINLENWILKDSSKTIFTFNNDYSLKPDEYLILYRDKFKFSLNNSGGDSVFLLDPDKNIIATMNYSETAKEDYSYSFDGTAWKWTSHKTPGKENEFNPVPKIKLKKIKTGYVDTPLYFEAEIKTKDKKNLKYYWDFDDGTHSYMQNTSHSFKKDKKYKIEFSVDDGNQKTTKDFSLQIKKYPKLSVQINSFLPNPAGIDTGNEWIEIKNNTDKKINLKNWKIATGIETMINHTILNDFIVLPKENKKITKKDCLFFLNNKQSNLELRYPNGKTASKISYDKNKILDDEICTVSNNICNWTAPKIKIAIETNSNNLEDIEIDEFADEYLVEMEEEEKEDEELTNQRLDNNNYNYDIKPIDENINEDMNLTISSKKEMFEFKTENKIIDEMQLIPDKKTFLELISEPDLNDNLKMELEKKEYSLYKIDNKYYFIIPSESPDHWAKKFIIDIEEKITSTLK